MGDAIITFAVVFVLLCLVLAWDSVWMVHKRNRGKGEKFTDKKKNRK